MGASVTASHVALFLCLLVSAATFNFISLCSGADQGVFVNTCSSKERQALLDIKQGLTDPSNWLSSWSSHHNDDCCQWTGVRCHNLTGAVIELHLQNYYAVNDKVLYGVHTFGGYISPSLLQLEYLSYLDLSFNDFQSTRIPTFLGSMRSLKHLDLYGASFGGLVPSQLQNLSSIRYLNLGYNQGLHVDSIGWVAHLSNLKYLDMSGFDLHRIEGGWLQVVSMVPSLSELYFQGCELDSTIPLPLGHVNFSSLQVLDLSQNRFSSKIPNWLFNLSSSLRELYLLDNSLYGEIPERLTTLPMLNSLDLSSNSLTGSIPTGIGQLKHLERLYLCFNKLNGSIPWTIGNLTSLGFLDLSFNQLDGTIPESTGLLSNLEDLSFDSNPMLRGIVSELNLAKLSKLKVLSLLNTSLSLSVNPRWTPPFQLKRLYMGSTKSGPEFPSWLQSQTSLYHLDISMSGIRDTAPAWFWEIASGIDSINLAGNQIKGDLTHALFNSTTIDISSNCFKGELPQLSSNVRTLKIGNNNLSGPISTFICGESNRNNNLEFLDMSMNDLSGELSDCWTHWKSLFHLNLGSNNFSGKIPISIGSLQNLKALQLYQNRLVGGIPLSLKNCTFLKLINLGENELTGIFPSWIWETKMLMVLSLRSNKLTGNIPVQLCQLSYIKVLDLANNNLSGTIPKCLSNFHTMVSGATGAEDGSSDFDLVYGYGHRLTEESLELVTKGTKSIYKKILRLVRLIDFSSNMLSGTIPTDISKLSGLRFFNLSRNHLVGEIPKKLGNMTNLESLDLSRNQLSGEIPESMSELSLLNNLDLSYNNLSGKIPMSTQLQSFNERSFMGNVGLCGAPLEKHCKNDTLQGSKPFAKEDAQEESEDDMFWFYIGVVPGYACAFCGVCTTLYFNMAWRQALFQFLEDLMNRVYVFAFVMVNQIKRRLKRSNVSVI